MTKTEPCRDMLGREQLTTVSRAQEILLENLADLKPATQVVPLDEALDRITTEAIISPEDLPPCDRSTMDGYAVVAADTYGAGQSLPAYLDVTGEVLMGKQPEGCITRGRCYKIPTGGIIPEGADAVLMFEHTIVIDEKMIEIVKDVGAGSNIIRRGDDIKKGAVAIPAGRKLRPQDLGLLAGLGIHDVPVAAVPTVGIISTGDELVDYRSEVPAGKIRNINAITLGNSVRRLGADCIHYGIVADTENSFFSAVERAVAETDLVLFSGGSSVGMKDLGEQAIQRIGEPGILVHGVALKPGKPVIIGRGKKTPVFGLPGHPVSALVCFDLFVKPALWHLSGKDQRDTFPQDFVPAILSRSINSAAGRLDIIRVRLEPASHGGYRAQPVLGRSGAISTLSSAHGYFIINEEVQGLQEGSPVEVFLHK